MSYDVTITFENIDTTDLAGLRRQAIDAGSGNLRITKLFDSWAFSQPSDQFEVSILNDDGEVDMEATCSIEQVTDEVCRYACQQGYIDPYAESSANLTVDMAQFDIWDASNVFQYAAFGEVIIS